MPINPRLSTDMSIGEERLTEKKGTAPKLNLTGSSQQKGEGRSGGLLHVCWGGKKKELLHVKVTPREEQDHWGKQILSATRGIQEGAQGKGKNIISMGKDNAGVILTWEVLALSQLHHRGGREPTEAF